jgi:hypothetical protein
LELHLLLLLPLMLVSCICWAKATQGGQLQGLVLPLYPQVVDPQQVVKLLLLLLPWLQLIFPTCPVKLT